MWWKTAKDRLIEHLEEELRAVREECAQLRAGMQETNAAARETKTVESETPRKPASRYMGDRMRQLSQKSMKNAMLRDPKRNLVAEMPPPGAHGPAAVFEGPRSAEK